jgi:hypothetical protein
MSFDFREARNSFLIFAPWMFIGHYVIDLAQGEPTDFRAYAVVALISGVLFGLFTSLHRKRTVK